MRTASIPSERESGAASPPAFDAQGVPPEGGQAPDLDGRGPETNGSKLALKNWRVRTRLIALIVIPTAAAIVLGGLRVTTSISTAAEYERVRTSAELVAELSDLAHNLETERDLSARLVAQGRGNTGKARLQEQYRAVDQVAKRARDRIDLIIGSNAAEGFGERGKTELAQMRSRIDELDSVRKTAVGTQLPAQPTIAMYSRTIADLLALHDEIIQGVADQELAGSATAFGALSRAKEQASRERANLAVALADRTFTSEGLNAMLAARAQRDSELATFRSDASVAQRQLYDDTVSSQKKDRAESMRARALVLAVEGAPLVRVDVSRTGAGDQTTWFDASSDTIERMRVVEKRIADTLITQSRVLQESEQQGALIAGGLSVLLLILVLAITAIMARSLVRPLRTLRTEALSIAGQRLPDTVQSMRESGEAAAEDVTPIGVASDDEIGQVARAFDEVHREAVRLAGQEATLRSNVNAMFVNLSRRSQTLVERQLSLIESLEQGEQDESRLGSLFRLDHLATRMRRNSENLLVLAGQEPARRWSQPIPLIDVVRASLSEVENYERVDLRLSAGVAVVGTSVNDVVHLIAELVENAISFSPRETKVVVSSNRIDGGGVMVSVTDIGIGMTPEELGQANWRLANPPVVDVSVSRRMGLFVVGRLALRHGIRVQLRQQDSGGLTAMVLLPETLLAASGARPAPGGAAAAQGGDWAAGSMSPMDRAPVLASPTSLDPAQQAFASFDAAHSFGSFDMGQQFGSFDAGQPAPGGGYFGQAPVDTPWPGHVPPPGADSGWPNTSQTDTGVWPNAPMRGGDSGAWPSPPSREGDSGIWPNAPMQGGDSGIWPTPPSREGAAGAWPDPPSREGGSGGWPSAGDLGSLERRAFEPADSTGPLPVVRDSSPMEEAKEEFLPIFAAVESDWFRKVDPAAPVQDLTEELKDAASPPPAPAADAWSSPADVGWQAAQAASEPSLGGITGSGLPKRVPKANLVPGTAAPDAGAAPHTPVLRPTVSPEAVRNRLASFQQGVRQGRAAARGEAGDGQPYPDFGRDVEGNKEDR
ncbi:Signal transduction histidine kinase [Streptosporangium canum]|uniref:histidine kinase n=1 Tax=Streptosporangium canum TaxID=324952 RepID=A0A1I3I1G8_9ACTN|nr:nitrate- and nitrite sensing domain-containing protein [Streptosporangium canum]SFI41677.1 Signal transduction histidine kinase [Streptosporangium canum]